MCKLQWLGLYTTKGITLKLHGLHFLMDECIRENNIDGNLRTSHPVQIQFGSSFLSHFVALTLMFFPLP